MPADFHIVSSPADVNFVFKNARKHMTKSLILLQELTKSFNLFCFSLNNAIFLPYLQIFAFPLLYMDQLKMIDSTASEIADFSHLMCATLAVINYTYWTEI